MKALAPQHPEWKDKEPFASLLKGDVKAPRRRRHAMLEIVTATHAGMTTEEFEKIVKDWFATAKHPQFKRPYTECVYQPMIELLAYLRANGFKTFIVSGGGIEFMRAVGGEGLWHPARTGRRQQHQDEVRNARWQARARAPAGAQLHRRQGGKPVGINQHIGRRPIAAFGNSDGDLQMLQYTAGGSGARFCMLRPPRRRGARVCLRPRRCRKIGTLRPGALDEAAAKGWTVISMKDDWKTHLRVREIVSAQPVKNQQTTERKQP